jgi:long-chain acyl-CoA synthetase
MQTMLQLFEARVNSHPGHPALRSRLGQESWDSFSWKEWWKISEVLAAGLIDLGLSPGDRVFVLSRTRVEWAWFDIAIMMAGGVTVPVFPSSLKDVCAEIAANASPAFAVVEDHGQWEKVKDLGFTRSGRSSIVCLEPWDGSIRSDLDGVDAPERPEVEGPLAFETLRRAGKRKLAEDGEFVSRRRTAVSSTDLATIVYTSGTSGEPKGVELTHGNLGAQVNALQRLQFLDATDRHLLFLPLAHILARIVLFACIAYGVETSFCEDPRKLLSACRSVRPTFFAGVPRVFEMIRHQVELQMRRRGGWRERVFRRALGQESSPAVLRMWAPLERRVHEEFVYQPFRALFGGQVRMLISGSAPLPRHLPEFYARCGIPLYEGYGLTETTGVVSVNREDAVRPGSVGMVLPGTDVAIAEDGEILVAGPSVMSGYRQRSVDASFDEEGWLHTGDIGYFDRDGFLFVTGRKKEIIITSVGKNIAPYRPESLLMESPYVAQAFVYGDARPFLTALISPDARAFAQWSEGEGASISSEDGGTSYRSLFDQVVEDANARLSSFERIRRYACVREEWTEDGGHLTPTGKIRRRTLENRYAHILESFYADGNASFDRGR